MRLLCIDFETTGLNTKEDRITEIGTILWDTELKKPLDVHNLLVWDDTYPKIPDVIVELTGITDEMLEEFGHGPKQCFGWLSTLVEKHRVDYVVAHNGKSFDKPFLIEELNRHGIQAPALRSLPWIDTKTDIPLYMPVQSNSLKYLAAEHGLCPNKFAHRAVFDVMTMLSILNEYMLDQVIARSKEKDVIVRAMFSIKDPDFQQVKAAVQAKGFRWELAKKRWVKRLKESDVEKFKNDCSFEVLALQE